MGLLNTDGAPMVWGSAENNRALKYVRDHGIQQLIILWNRYKGGQDYPFLWGDELEHTLVQEDPKTGELKLSLNAAPILEKLVKEEVSKSNTHTDWRPEYGSFMIESVPGAPFTDDLASFLKVESNMADRVRFIDEACGPGERALLIVSFPLMGVGDFHTKPEDKCNQYSDSIFISDICINQTHPRFGNLTRNIRYRRGRKVCIQIPMFMDVNTCKNTVDRTYNIDANPKNDLINCAAQDFKLSGSKRVRDGVLGGGSDGSDEGGENGDGVQDDEEIARRLVTKQKQTPRRSCCPNSVNGGAPPTPGGLVGTTGAISKQEQAFFKHMYTPSSDYYYAQYIKGQNLSANVAARYSACPCPVPSVDHPCIYMDCMAFGMGLSCLQVTMQLKDIDQARHMYDQVVPLCGPLLALTSATPFQKGILCDSDVRWVTISASVDDRKPTEVPRILKSRYDSVSMYISNEPEEMDMFNDGYVEIEDEYFQQVVQAGMDTRLARHFAHLFIRDPLVIFEHGVEQLDDTKRSDHFENIQSTNWQTVRFKPPPADSDIGWRVEFRVMEIQPTPFENAAFSVFIILLSKAMLKYDAITYIPMSLVDRNMGRAHCRQPCKQKYHWRANMLNVGAKNASNLHSLEMTVDEIFNGIASLPACGSKFEGLIPMCRRYLKDMKMDTDPKLNAYLNFISRRASGQLATTADLLRDFVTSHPDYKKDSRLTPTIAKDIASFVSHLGKTQAWPGYLPADLTGGTQTEFKRGQKWA